MEGEEERGDSLVLCELGGRVGPPSGPESWGVCLRTWITHCELGADRGVGWALTSPAARDLGSFEWQLPKLVWTKSLFKAPLLASFLSSSPHPHPPAQVLLLLLLLLFSPFFLCLSPSKRYSGYLLIHFKGPFCGW